MHPSKSRLLAGAAILALSLNALTLAGCDRGHKPPPPDTGGVVPPLPTPVPAPSGQAIYDCAGGQAVQATYAGDNATVVYLNQTYLLKRTPATDSPTYAGQGRQWTIRTTPDRETGTLANASGQAVAQCVKRAPGAPPPAPVPAPPCRSGDLSLSKVGADAGAGQRQVTYAFVNNGAAACSLKGYPTLSLFDADGKRADGVTTVQTEQSYFNVGGPPQDVNIAHNARGLFYISFTGIQATDKPCVAIARVQATPPGNTQAIEVSDTLSVCTGQIRLSPIRPDSGAGVGGANGPLFY